MKEFESFGFDEAEPKPKQKGSIAFMNDEILLYGYDDGIQKFRVAQIDRKSVV